MEEIKKLESLKSVASPTLLESLVSLTKSVTKSFNNLIRTQSSSDEVTGNMILSREELVSENAKVFDNSIRDKEASDASIRGF